MPKSETGIGSKPGVPLQKIDTGFLGNFVILNTHYYYIIRIMLAVHWTPVSKTKTILKNGITKSRNGLYCFPLTGHKFLDKWWVSFFNQSRTRQRKKYNGILFRLKQDDMPANFGHWVGATNKDQFNKEISTLKTLGEVYRHTLLCRLGEELSEYTDSLNSNHDTHSLAQHYCQLAESEIRTTPKALAERMKDPNFMSFALEDYQIVLTKSISADRILKVIPQGDDFGRAIRLRKKYGVQLSIA